MNKKETYLTILGILLLIGTSLGLTYAFYSYAKTGDVNNSITAGTLIFNFENETNQINFINAFPLDDGAADQDTVGRSTFVVSGLVTNPESAINYKVLLIPGDQACYLPSTSYPCSGTGDKVRVRLPDHTMKLQLTASTSNGSNSDITINNGFNSTDSLTSLGNYLTNQKNTVVTSSGYEIASGIIRGLSNGTSTSHTYVLKMWISEDRVEIQGNPDTLGPLEENYTSEQYENMYYSVKVKVIAADSTETLN